MLNVATANNPNPHTGDLVTTATAHTVVVVNGNPHTLRRVETVLDAGHYNLFLVPSFDDAYSQIKRLRPHLVVMCLRLDETLGFQVLSMLKLDQETRNIPVLTYATESEDPKDDREWMEREDAETYARLPVRWMN